MPVSKTKERPILMSAPMIRALLSGAKTQTRRIMKVQPEEGGYVRPNGDNWNVCLSPDHYKDIQNISWKIQGTHHVSHILKCPYGKVGDRLWCRETSAARLDHEGNPDPNPRYVKYRADFKDKRKSPHDEADWHTWPDKWTPSIFMPRWASRITLEITDVRVQRLQDICVNDCLAEGVGEQPCKKCTDDKCIHENVPNGMVCTFKAISQVDGYQRLWESINGEGSWDLNDWVWAISFRRING